MSGYGQFCPVAKAAEVVAERWTPLVLRELLAGGRRFNDIHRGVPLMSRTLLAARLEQLERAGIVRSVARPRGRGREYHVTPAGEELRPLIDCLGEWGQRWARAQIGRADLDPGLLMWDIHRRINLKALPPQRVVTRFDFRGVPAGSPRAWWLVLERRNVDLCLKDPGFPVDLVINADLRTMVGVWMGDVRLSQALRANLIQLDGPQALVRAFPSWLELSEFADVRRVGTAAGVRYRSD